MKITKTKNLNEYKVEMKVTLGKLCCLRTALEKHDTTLAKEILIEMEKCFPVISKVE